MVVSTGSGVLVSAIAVVAVPDVASVGRSHADGTLKASISAWVARWRLQACGGNLHHHNLRLDALDALVCLSSLQGAGGNDLTDLAVLVCLDFVDRVLHHPLGFVQNLLFVYWIGHHDFHLV